MAGGTRTKGSDNSKRLRTAEEIYHGLLRNRKDIIITTKQAVAVFKLFRGVDVGEVSFHKVENRAFVQAALMSAIEGSAAMGWIEALFHSAYKPNASVKGVMKALVKEAFRQYYRKTNLKDLDIEDLKLYSSVMVSIVRSHRVYFDLIYEDIEF